MALHALLLKQVGAQRQGTFSREQKCYKSYDTFFATESSEDIPVLQPEGGRNERMNRRFCNWCMLVLNAPSFLIHE